MGLCYSLLCLIHLIFLFFFFFQAEDGIRDWSVTGVQTCALPISKVALDLMLGNQPHEVIYLKEYQNLLYLVDKNSGIWVFDNLGNFKKKLNYKGVQWFTVVGDRKSVV